MNKKRTIPEKEENETRRNRRKWSKLKLSDSEDEEPYFDLTSDNYIVSSRLKLEENWIQFQKNIDMFSFATSSILERTVKNDDDIKYVINNFFTHEFNYPPNEEQNVSAFSQNI